MTLGVYIQVPFCASKCSFCNFSSRVERASAFDAYVRALEIEIEQAPRLSEKGIAAETLALAVDTIYIGGGTPSLLGGERLARIVQALRRRFDVQAQLECTLEVTPGSADRELLKKLLELGVNRLSIGAQTFSDQELSSVGRLHSAEETGDLVRRAREAGFANLSLDLIAGLPHQTEESWSRTLESAAELKPEHVSLYLFEIDEKSRLGREVLHDGARYHAAAVPDEEFMAKAYESGRQFLAREGYGHYEISNFALAGFESRHNLKYWNLEPYRGFGAGAHSFDGMHRWANEPDLTAYMEQTASGMTRATEWRALSLQEQIEEFFFLGLRRRQGVSLAAAERRWGRQRIEYWRAVIARLERQGWLECEGERVRLADRALLVSNEVFQEFLADGVQVGATGALESPSGLRPFC